jgi:hypothetical protein
MISNIIFIKLRLIYYVLPNLYVIITEKESKEFYFNSSKHTSINFREPKFFSIENYTSFLISISFYIFLI